MAINTEKATKIGRALILLCLLGIAGIIVSRYYSSRPGSFMGAPKEYELNYMPADYNINIDPEDALAIGNNPERYRREFDQMIYDINTGMLDHVARRMGLNDSLRQAVVNEYERNHHDYLKNLYFQDFMALKDTTAQLYETWYDNESGGTTKVLREITSKYSCFLINQIVATVLPTKGGSVFAKGSGLETPCGIAMSEVLAPMMDRLSERAAIEDFSRSRGLLQEKVERVIAELATMEVQDKKGMSKQTQTQVFGLNVSSSDVEITAISNLKVGFRLNDRFDLELNPRAKLVTITLPEPVILSHEVYPKIEKLDIGWLREVEMESFNEAFNALRKEFRREAMESNIMERSEQQAIELMNTLFGPLVKSINNQYEIKVRFEPASGGDAPFADEDYNG